MLALIRSKESAMTLKLIALAAAVGIAQWLAPYVYGFFLLFSW